MNRKVLQQALKASGERRQLIREDRAKALRPLSTAGAEAALAECEDGGSTAEAREHVRETVQVKRMTLAFTLVKMGWYRKVLDREVTSLGTGLAGTYGYGSERSLQGDLTHRVPCGLLW